MRQAQETMGCRGSRQKQEWKADKERSKGAQQLLLRPKILSREALGTGGPVGLPISTPSRTPQVLSKQHAEVAETAE